MTDRNSRKRGITVELLDLDMLTEACIDHGIASPAFMQNALLRRLDGGAAVIVSSEGVCSSKILMGRVFLDTESREWQSLPLSVVEPCLTGETLDLADHIRTFGSRLDANHSEWFRWASEETR